MNLEGVEIEDLLVGVEAAARLGATEELRYKRAMRGLETLPIMQGLEEMIARDHADCILLLPEIRDAWRKAHHAPTQAERAIEAIQCSIKITGLRQSITLKKVVDVLETVKI